MTLTYLLLALLIIVNLAAFLAIFIDKRRSASGTDRDRIPEGILFFFATIGGSIGIYLAMITLRHKTHKWYFQIGIPALIIQQASLVYLIIY